MPGHFLSLFAIFSSFSKQYLQQLKPVVERPSAQWFWEQLECFWLNLGFKIYIGKSPVNVHKFPWLRADFRASCGTAHPKFTSWFFGCAKPSRAVPSRKWQSDPWLGWRKRCDQRDFSRLFRRAERAQKDDDRHLLQKGKQPWPRTDGQRYVEII